MLRRLGHIFPRQGRGGDENSAGIPGDSILVRFPLSFGEEVEGDERVLRQISGEGAEDFEIFDTRDP